MTSMASRLAVDEFVEEKEFSVNGLTYRAKVWGPKDGKPVIALHGWLDNANTYDVIAPLLPSLRICSVDLAGHGYSDHRPGWGQYYFFEYVYDILEIAEQLGWGTFSLMGHSMGAHIATIIAGTEPEKVEQLMLIEGFGTPSNFSAAIIPEMNRKMYQRIRRLRGKKPPVYPSLDAMVKARVAGFFKISEAGARILTERSCVSEGDGYTWRMDPKLKLMSPAIISHEQFCEFIKQITAPTCLILADKGVPHSKELLDERIKCHNNLRIEHMQGGHHLHLEEQAPAVAEIIADFFQVPACIEEVCASEI